MNTQFAERILNVADIKWEHPRQFDAGIDQLVVVDTLDERAKRGMRTRLVRFSPGAGTRVPFLHDYHEEVYLVSGDQSRLDVATFERLDTYLTGSYFVRPAGTSHGPFSSEAGCVLLEIHYYDA
jgi:hypothetical protein